MRGGTGGMYGSTDPNYKPDNNGETTMTQIKSNLIASRDAKPPVIVDSRLSGGVLKHAGAVAEIPATTAIGDSIIMLALPVDALLHDVFVAADQSAPNGELSIGFYRQGADGSYPVVHAFALQHKTGDYPASQPLAVRFAAKGIETADQKIYELAGLQARPDYDFLYLGFTIEAPLTGVGALYMRAIYTD